MKRNSFIKRGIAVVLAWLMVITSIAPAAYAEDYNFLIVNDTIGSVQDAMGREAEAMLFAHILVNCIAGGIDVDDKGIKTKTTSNG